MGIAKTDRLQIDFVPAKFDCSWKGYAGETNLEWDQKRRIPVPSGVGNSFVRVCHQLALDHRRSKEACRQSDIEYVGGIAVKGDGEGHAGRSRSDSVGDREELIS